MSDGIAGKIVLITGSSSGVGESTAELLAARGAKVALAARRKDRLDDIVGRITKAGGTARACQMDVKSRSQVQACVDAVVADFGRLDVIVNNAGIMPIRPMAEVNVDEWDDMIDVNVKGMLYGIAAALPLFIAQRDGHVINVGSTAGLKVSSSGAVVYSATKFAVHALTEGLRIEAGKDLRVTLIVPGPVSTNLSGTTNDPAIRQSIEKMFEIALPPEAIARAIAYAIEQPRDVDVNQVVVRPTVYAG